ncbi:hypothetical protein SAMN04487830_14019 [Pseudobutyrivibrio sp. OR37]|uniref:beta-L-arabinofuranosidase domain-containing protein n=1 Tax=Pseudobutyrivibrio sp. OR37 TaxID=1798186 RepID=UPI0008E56FD3|nr:beta-L-arabinofuranosidase domain-containing protein [Pseudobutyrivibrio sp. OR37]SFI30998.1 hypothetical protein SAMN04487830_14019 [Pseudobutyrivibrio sp. OR37]
MNKTLKPISLAACKVTDSYYDEAFHLQVKNMLALDPDRLLAGFRETAGIIVGMDEKGRKTFMNGKERYTGGWENGLIGGHTLGHYVKALAQAEANPGLDTKELKAVKERLDYMINALEECQNKTLGTAYEGYLFGATLPTKEYIDNPALQFDYVEKGMSDPFKQAWVPWYTMHKILSGLNAAYLYAKNEKALQVANKLGVWIANRCEGWTEEQHKNVLSIEYGGMNDCLYELYEINRSIADNGVAYSDFERFKNAAHSFDEIALFKKITAGGTDILNDTHANTTIPKFIGALARYEVDNSASNYLKYASDFFDMVTSKHTYITGGNSENEHFGRDNILNAERTNTNNETCNTYNMIRLARRLFAVTGDKKYLDYSEQTLINAIMASQNHTTGFTTYFQPMGTGFQKVFNTLDGNFWCCTGTGYENFTKLQDGIYFEGDDKLIVAMYLSSEYKADGYTLIQECDFTKSDEVKIRVDVKEASSKVDLYLRIPHWIQGKPEVKVGNSVVEPKEENGFYVISKELIGNDGDITIRWPMGITCHNLVDGKDTYAFCYGPYVLSAKLGTKHIKIKPHGIDVVVAAEKCVDSDDVVITAEATVDAFMKNISKYLVKQEGSMDFELTGTNKKLIFTTHYNQYKESYGIYWNYAV